MTVRLRAGFLPLVDAANLLVAARMGFAEAEGLELVLSRERSWAAVRDKLSVGYLDCAHVLSPMVVASQLGLGNFRSRLIAPVMLSMDGNEVVLGSALANLCAARTGYTPAGPVEWGRAVAAVVREGAAKGAPPFNFAAVFPYSAHAYLLRDWLSGNGLDPDRDVNVSVLPPSMMADALSDGSIDGFCAGPPWGRLSEERGAGRIAFRAVRLRSGVAEKALALRENDPLRDPETLAKLVRAIAAASRWVGEEANGEELFALLARAELVGVAAHTIRAAVDRSGMRLSGDGVLRPDQSHGAWCIAQMRASGRLREDRAQDDAAAARAFRYDLFDAAVAASAP